MEAIKKVLRGYSQPSFTVTQIECDLEFVNNLAALEGVLGVHFNSCNPDDHVPEAERNIRFLKERFRTQYHRLPFTKFPKI